MRYLRAILTIVPTALLLIGLTGPVLAQAGRSDAAAATANRIAADTPAFRIEWNGATGSFVRKALGGAPETRMPLLYLHTDAGPTGFATHLVWFLAREPTGFSILWCYMNAAGDKFDCWLYGFPGNVLTPVHFVGPYTFTPPAEPVAPVPMSNLNLVTIPPYTGPEFTFKNWTRAFGGLPQLDLKATRQSSAPPAATNSGAVAKSIHELLIRPLHQVEVASANGWRESGWHELHALAMDAEKDPYYLILYSNSPIGYAIDLKRAQLYTTDFGGRVSIGGSIGGPQDTTLNVLPETKVRRYDRFEITLKSTEMGPNPYIDSPVGIEFHGPDAKTTVVPGFWDGGDTFRVRFAPTVRGVWSWKSLSSQSDLDGKTGSFECIGEEASVKGFVNVQPDYKNPRHFAYSNGDGFLPSYLREPAPDFTALSGAAGASLPGTSTIRLAELSESAPQDDGGSFIAFQRFINAISQKGFNRLVGGAILGPAAARTVRANEGGAALTSADLATINPAFFQAMDRRIAYCNAHGVVPDIGVSTLDDALFTNYSDSALYRLWGYIVARYSSFDVQWTLFAPGSASPSAATRKGAEKFAELTRLYDPLHHPVTIIAAGSSTPAVAPASVATSTKTGGALSEPVKQVVTVPYDLSWEDVITAVGGDVNALPIYTTVKKPVVLLELAASGKNALTPDVIRHRLWETRMRGAYWAPGTVPMLDASNLSAPDIQFAAYCESFFQKTRFFRLAPRQDMLGGPAETAADKRRRKRAEAAAAIKNPPADTDPIDIDPFAADPFANLPPAPAPKQLPMFVLVDPAREYVAYLEQGGTLLIDLLEATGKLQVTWFNPRTGVFSAPTQIDGGAYVPFTAPDSQDWVLYVTRQ